MDTANIIALAGIAFVVIFALLPYTRFRPPRTVVYLGLTFGFLLLAIAAIETWEKIAPGFTVTFVRSGEHTSIAVSGWSAAITYGLIFAAMMWVSVRLLQLPYQGTTLEESRWGSPLSHNLLETIDDTKNLDKNARLKVKMIATEKGKRTAESLVEFLKYCDWDILINHNGGSYIFPAAKPFKGALLRHRESDSSLVGWVSNPVTIFAEYPRTEHFPESDDFNFIQIEIGDGPS
jgi:hypothetical protein